MAFTLQTLPEYKPKNPYEGFMRGFSDIQKAQTNRLQQQKMKKDLDNYDRILNAELSKMLAATESSQAQTATSKQQLINAQFEQMLAEKYGEKQLLNEMAYKSAIGKASIDNAIIAGINADIAQAKLPGDLAAIEAANRQQQLNNIVMAAAIQSASTGQSIEEILANSGYGNLVGGGATGASGAQQTPVVDGISSDDPRDYLKPKQGQTIDVFSSTLNKLRDPLQLAQEQAYAEQEGRELSKGYHAYANETAEKARIAGEQSVVITNLRNAYANTPEITKGEVLGYLGAIPSQAQLFESIKSGAVMEVLALQKGVQGENDRKSIEKTYGGRTMNEVTMDELLTLKDIANDRLMEKNNKLVAPEVGQNRSRGEVEAAWIDYINDNSIFDTPKYQAFLERKWSTMSPLEKIEDQKRYLNFRKSMMESK